MDSANFMLSLLIPGPKALGNNMGVFLQPLIDELKVLWEVGVKTFDAYSQELFDMFEVLIWTVQDFPRYADVSGWTQDGFLLVLTVIKIHVHKD